MVELLLCFRGGGSRGVEDGAGGVEGEEVVEDGLEAGGIGESGEEEVVDDAAVEVEKGGGGEAWFGGCGGLEEGHEGVVKSVRGYLGELDAWVVG